MKRIAHNGLVAGSSPAGPTSKIKGLAVDLRGYCKSIEPKHRATAAPNLPHIHFVGFRGEEYWSAVKVWGEPDFYHIGWDLRAQREIGDGDTVVFARGDADQQPSRKSFNDLIE